MKDIEEVKQVIRDNIKIKSINPDKSGGQSCGNTYCKISLYSEDLDLTIETGYYRSSLRNKQLVTILFDLALDDMVF